MKTIHSASWTKISAVLRRSAICAIALAAILQGATALGQVQIVGSLPNFDVRYPNSLPNDLEIVLYGDGITPASIINTYPNPQWGPASSITGSVNNDPTSPGFGLDCVVVRYSGSPLPSLAGQMLHFGVRLRIGTPIAHQEVWWTINGVRINRPCDPHVTWICTTNGWLVCVANPTNVPIYVYGCRFFQPATTASLPQLVQLNTNINPTAFGAPGWTPVPPPGTGPVFCIPGWCRIYFRVITTTWRPIVVQIAARNVPEQVLPLPPGTNGPNPNDFDGQNGTMAILTVRPTQEFREDINGDGSVGTPDFNMLRLRFGTQSVDVTGN